MWFTGFFQQIDHKEKKKNKFNINCKQWLYVMPEINRMITTWHCMCLFQLALISKLLFWNKVTGT